MAVCRLRGQRKVRGLCRSRRTKSIWRELVHCPDRAKGVEAGLEVVDCNIRRDPTDM